MAVGNAIHRITEDAFVVGATFEAAVRLYVFDKRLWMLVLDAIERLEVALRVDIAYNLGQKDPFAHINASLLHGHFSVKLQKSGKTRHQEWLEKLDDLTDRSKEDFVAHFRAKYGNPLPIWVVIELWDFGLLSNFYAGMKPADRVALAIRFGVPDDTLMSSWLRTLNYIRNIAAHHSRLWNRNMIDQPKMPSAGQIPIFDPYLSTINIGRPYATLCILAYLMSQVCPRSQWRQRVLALLRSFPATGIQSVDVLAMGCHPGWENEPFWN